MQQDWIILKFGGSSVGKPEHWQTIAKQVQQRLEEGLRPVLVLSALKNVSNLLEDLLHQALAGNHPTAIERLVTLHLDFAEQLGLKITDQLAPWFKQLNYDCQNLYQSGHISPRLHARILAVGEFLSTTIGAQYLNSQGHYAVWQDVRQLLKSNNQPDPRQHYTATRCDYQFNPSLSSRLGDRLNREKGILVTQGFVAADMNNETVLLGREGSDTSAAYLGATLGARQVEIWTDVTGIFSANPAEFPDAHQLPKLSYNHARLMARFGAKVLHPAALRPVEENNIPINVRCTARPEHAGTQINIDGEPHVKVKAVVYKSEITRIIFPESLPREQLKERQTLLSALGFDQMLLQEFNGRDHLILDYNNSDAPQPTRQQIELNFSDLELSIYPGCSLITLVGENTDSDWISSSVDLLKATAPDALIDVYLDDSRDRLSFLVKTEKCLQLATKLHALLVDEPFSN